MARRRTAPGSPAPQSQRSKTPAFRRRARLLFDASFGRALFLMSESTAIPPAPRGRSAEGSLVQNGSRALVRASVIPAEPQQRRGPESILTGCGYGFRARAYGAPRNDGREFRASAPRRPRRARSAHSRWVIVDAHRACGQSADKLLSIL